MNRPATDEGRVMTPHETLKAAKALIDSPERWTTRIYAIDANKNCVNTTDKAAVCRCSVGALGAVTPNYSEALRAMALVIPNTFHYNVVRFNDDPDTTHADVMAAFDRAIAATAPAGGVS
jgi:hypothetical protein